MRAEELRLGNYVHSIELNQDVTLSLIDKEGWISFNDITFDYPCVEDIEPIPITVDWLLKLGFGYHAFDKNYVITTKKDWHNSIKEMDGDWCYNNDFSDANCYFVREVKYIHQLQNLYYAINEEELICK